MTWLVLNRDGEPVYRATDEFDAERQADMMNDHPATRPGWPYEPIYDGPLCFVCDKPFTEAEWDDHHSNFDPDDPDTTPEEALEVAHADCCPFCTQAAAVDREAFVRERG